MAKIIHLPTQKSDIVTSLEYILEEAKAGNIEDFVFATKMKDNTVATSYSEMDLGAMQELISHMQVDIIDMAIKASFLT